MGFSLDRQSRLEDEFPGQVGLQGVGRHRAKDDGFDQLWVDPAPVEHTARCVDGHVQGIEFREGLSRLDEGRTASGDDGDPISAHVFGLLQCYGSCRVQVAIVAAGFVALRSIAVRPVLPLPGHIRCGGSCRATLYFNI